MDVLVLGGSVFLGRAVVGEAVAAGHRVTVFNRGRSGPTPEGAEQVTGDRTVRADLEQLTGRRFDVVVDTSGYVPAEVALSASVLAPLVGHYAFVSTVNVYPGWPEDEDYHDRGTHPGEPDATRADAPDEESAYGWLKAGCESAVLREFGGQRASVLRAGCIVGPHDGIGRLPWWIERVSRGGTVLVPGTPDYPMALIDARDLARFALRGVAGQFEVSGPPDQVTRGELLAACRAATGSDAQFLYVDEDWLAGQDVEPWTEVPLWAPGAPSLFRHDVGPAIAAGLSLRPVLATVTDTWAWQRSTPGGWRPTGRTPGLSSAREQALLATWRASRSS